MVDLLQDNVYHFDGNIKKIVEYGAEIVDELINYGIEFYNNLSREKNIGSAENPIIGSFFSEAIDTADGIRLLYRETCVNAASPLVRKLFEIYMQASYLLIDDSEEKAIAYEAYYISRICRGKDVKEATKDVYVKYPSYAKYKQQADLAYTERKYYEWYEVYKGEKISFKKMSKEIDEEEVYNSVYNLLSKDSHGLFARNNIETDMNGNGNYIREYRHPGKFMKQLVLVRYIMWRLYARMVSHYDVDDSFLVTKAQEQNKKFKNIQEMWKEYNLPHVDN